MTERKEMTPLQRAVDATAWAVGWKTWPENGRLGAVHAAIDAALEVANEQPEMKRFDLACVAVNAAGGES